MPLLKNSNYRPPLFFGNAHVQTIYPSLFRKIKGMDYERERIETPDGDFLDIDWSLTGSDKVAILSHGLEGNTDRSYIKGLARCLNRSGWDAAAWNFRGCSGEMNRKPQFYHSGATYDLETVIHHVLSTGRYASVFLVGVSMGGNMTLKYLAEKGGDAPKEIRAAAAFSVPCDLTTSATQISNVAGGLYFRRFMRMLKEKVELKAKALPGLISDEGLDEIRDFKTFDDRYTAPLYGFRDAHDYWEKASCKPHLMEIRVPSLLINALDDPFLTPECFPRDEAVGNPHLFLETPANGGHVGFIRFANDGTYWHEKRAVQFFKEVLGD